MEKTWQALAEDDPTELLARAILSEEAEKLLSGEMADAEGVAWVIRNRHDKWKYSWYDASTSGINGMKSAKLARVAADPLGRAGFYGGRDAAEEAYVKARAIAEKVLSADASEDPTGGALYYSDGYCTYSDCRDTESDPDSWPDVTPWERTHFWIIDAPHNRLDGWCVKSVRNCH